MIFGMQSEVECQWWSFAAYMNGMNLNPKVQQIVGQQFVWVTGTLQLDFDSTKCFDI